MMPAEMDKHNPQSSSASFLNVKGDKKNNPASSAHSVATTAATSLSSGTTTFSFHHHHSSPAAVAPGLVSAGRWQTTTTTTTTTTLSDDDDENENDLVLESSGENTSSMHLFPQNVSLEQHHQQQVTTTTPTSRMNHHIHHHHHNHNHHQQLFQFSSLGGKLYGREKEIQLLQEALERTAASAASSVLQENHENGGVPTSSKKKQPENNTEIVLVSGYPGTGKSALVLHALQEQCRTVHGGCFCYGKYDLLNQDDVTRCGGLPYSAISTAFVHLVENILLQQQQTNDNDNSNSNSNTSRLDELRSKLDNALFLGHNDVGEHSNEEVLQAVIPNLHLLLRTQRSSTTRTTGGGGDDDDAELQKQQQQPGEITITTTPASASSTTSSSSSEALLLLRHYEKTPKLFFLLRLFMKLVCKLYCPVVLHLDDLQWADAASLNLLCALVMDTEGIAGLMFVGCYRDNEVLADDNNHKLFTLFLNQLHNHNNKGYRLPSTTTPTSGVNANNNNNGIRLTTISVHNLDQVTIKSMLQDLLQMNNNHESSDNDDDTETLARVVHTKTYGNIFFVIQFLKTLQQMDLLTFHKSINAAAADGQFEWHWDKDEIARNHQKMIATDNVTELMTLDIEQRLSVPAQNALKIAACLGNAFEESMIVLLIIKMSEENKKHDADLGVVVDDGFVWDGSTTTDENQAKQLLEQCVQGGFLCRQSNNTTAAVAAEKQQQVVSYRFVHDVVQEAAISLIAATGHHDLAHFHIGKVLVENLPAHVQEQNLFVLVDMMNHGMKAHTLKQTRSLLINLNLQAGKKALKSSAFEAAVQYISISVTLLGHDCWDESNYASTLDLFSTAAQAELCNANPDKCKWYIDHVLAQTQQQGSSIQDKFRVSTCLIDYYNFQEKHADALSTSIMVIKQLGVDFGPPTLLPVATLTSLLKTRRLLRDMNADDILCLPPMTDKTKRMAMMLMDPALTCSFLLSSPYFSLLEYKMVRWSIKHGLCPQSATAFATYGSLLVGAMGELEEARLMGKVAEELSRRPGWRETRCRIIMLTNSKVFPWTNHVRSCLKPLLSGYELGMKEGDLENALFCASLYGKLSICAGRPLHLIHADMLAFTAQMKVHSQESIYKMCLPDWQLVLNLMGESAPDPPLLSGEIMEFDETMKHLVETNHVYLQDATRMNQLQLAFYFGDYQLAWDMVEDSKNFEKTNMAHVTVWRRSFFEGMTAFCLARHSNNGSWRRRGRKAIAQLKKWLKGGNGNCIHLLHLLMAEEEALLQCNYMDYHESLLDAEFGWEILLEAGIVSSDTTLTLFQKALSTAARAGFIHDAALAAERTAEYLSIGLSSWDTDHAAKGRVCEYLELAIISYTEWGAFGKVDQLKRKWASWFQLECTECSELGSDIGCSSDRSRVS